MGLWELLTAETLIVCDATEGTMDLLSSIEQADCFRPKIWTQLQVSGASGPGRGHSSGESQIWTRQEFRLRYRS